MQLDLHYPDDLPISAHREEIVEAIRNNQVVIVAGDTGSGKTTQLPKMCLEAGRGKKKRVGCTQPRRIAAISVAARVAEELGPRQSDRVGYKIRFQDKTSRATRIKFMTDGILLAEAQSDNQLRAYDTIIIDEAHERSLNIDFLLGMLKRLLAKRRDLKVLITSATIDTEKFAKNFSGAPIIQVAGRTFPVEVRYRPIDPGKEEEGEQTYIEQAVAAVQELRDENEFGDILIFMPTERDIRETTESLLGILEKKGKGRRAAVLPLFGRLSPGDQRKIFRPATQQKIVVATNVAETSITVPGIRTVIDTGLARFASYNVRARTSKLPIVPISRASCDQRKGRCGRVGPGICIRLFAEDDYVGRNEYTAPEIQRSNLAEVILRMIHLRLGNPAKFPFIDPPSSRAMKDGYNLLTELGALDRQRHLTNKGRLMAKLPLDPRIARMVIEARDNNALKEVAIIAAALSIQDPRVRPADKEAQADQAHARFTKAGSDFLFFLALWDAYHDHFEEFKSLSKMRKFCKSHYLAFQRMREWRDIHEQICVILKQEKGFALNDKPASVPAIHRSILSGHLRTIGLKKEKNIYQAAGGKEVMVFPGSAIFNKTGHWLMAAEFVETSKLFARTVATIEPEWLEPLAQGLTRSTYADPHWEKKRGQVVANEKVTLFGLVIVPRRKVNFGKISPEEARQIFIQSALVEGEIKGDYTFLNRNQELIQKFQELEDRVRRRGIMVDEFTLSRFYDERLALEVRDQRSLNRWLKKQGGDAALCMTEEDIRQESPATAELEQFPEELILGDFTLPLSYKFSPGADDDGVTVRIPLNLVPHLRAEPFVWLVPGLLLEKITFLLKGLPKATRKPLVPIPQTAEAILLSLEPYQGSLYRSLEQAIYDGYGFRIEARQWPISDLPAKLRFRYCVVNGKGKEMQSSREFTDFAAMRPSEKALDNKQFAGLCKKWEQKNVDMKELSPVAEQFPVTAGDGILHGYVFSALVINEDKSVSLKLINDQEKAREKTRAALLALYSAEFGKQLKKAKKDWAIPRGHWALYEGLGSYEAVNEEILNFVLVEVFALSAGSVTDGETFKKQVAAVKEKGFVRSGKEVFDEIISVLEERRATLDTISKFSAMSPKGGAHTSRFKEYRKEVLHLLPPGFLLSANRANLAATPRYLNALRLRVERAHASPAKDAAKSEQVKPHVQQLARLEDKEHHSPECRTFIAEYRGMIEEFKVSLFAQELKTAFPISVKRLEKKWQEISALCL